MAKRFSCTLPCLPSFLGNVLVLLSFVLPCCLEIPSKCSENVWKCANIKPDGVAVYLACATVKPKPKVNQFSFRLDGISWDFWMFFRGVGMEQNGTQRDRRQIIHYSVIKWNLRWYLLTFVLAKVSGGVLRVLFVSIIILKYLGFFFGDFCCFVVMDFGSRPFWFKSSSISLT